jgi:hypothetical protein
MSVPVVEKRVDEGGHRMSVPVVEERVDERMARR